MMIRYFIALKIGLDIIMFVIILAMKKNYNNASNYCKQLHSTLTNNNTILVNLTKTLNLTKTYNHESNYWVNYSLIKNESVLLRDSGYYKKQKHVSLLYICSK